jgi:poly-gamma-glutamate synthesis protein (capsule biosynthesis protein)
MLLSAPLIAHSDETDTARRIYVADVKVRYHLIPGVNLKAQSEPLDQTTSAHAGTPKTDPRPVVPAVASNKGRDGNGLWEPHCPAPVRVSFFGDYWVPPYSPAANLKKKLFDKLSPLLNWSDFNVVNFEGSVTKAKTRAFPKFPYALRQVPESLEWLAGARIKHFTRANNHAMDFGWSGANDTSTAMNKAGASFAGVGQNLNAALKPMWLVKDGIRIAVFSLTTTYPAEAWASKNRAGVAHPTQPAMQNAIAAAREQADFVVAAFHWGQELSASIKTHQEEYAKQALKAGADVVVGHHAHLAQKIDSDFDDGVIVYGVGNFIFSSLSRDAKFGLGAHFEFCRGGESAANAENTYRLVLTPLMTYNRTTGYQTRPMTRAEFIPFARDYLKKGLFSSNLEFYLPSEQRVDSLSEWLRAGPQASKEGHAVN